MDNLNKSFKKEFMERPYEEGIVYADGEEILKFIRQREKELLMSCKKEIDELKLKHAEEMQFVQKGKGSGAIPKK